MQMNSLAPIEFNELKPSEGYERLVQARDSSTGLVAFISVHSTKLGPAAGGCRMFNYPSIEAAVYDAERLSRGMTYKNAAASLALGGGKSVIVGDPTRLKTPELMRSFGAFVNSLDGQYFAAEDVGISPQDLAYTAEKTKFVAGLNGGKFASGDPSPFTAIGVFKCMQVTWQHLTGTRDLSGVSVAIQGLGHVGMHLAKFLNDAGANLVVCDLNAGQTEMAKSLYGAVVVAPDQIEAQEVDMFAPCAMGAALNERTVPMLKARAVVGAANNQLAASDTGRQLQDRGILYAPDYVVNGGGIINVAMEVLQITDPAFRQQRLDGLGPTLSQILEISKMTGGLPHQIADEIVETRLAAA